MRPGSTARFVVALLGCGVVSDVAFSRAMTAAYRGLGGWGAALALVGFGAGLALLFTAVHDGPRALALLARRRGAGEPLAGGVSSRLHPRREGGREPRCWSS